MFKFWETPLWLAATGAKKVERQTAPTAKQQQRMYAAARQSRLTGSFTALNSSANAELQVSLANMRGRSRQLVRDSAYAKRAKKVVVDNVIGTGIGMQAEVRGTRSDLRKPVNDAIETAWYDWCRGDRCHTGGQLNFSDIERVALGQVFEAGEIFIRIHSRGFSDSAVPLSLEIIEPERLADDYMLEPGARQSGTKVVQGIEVDSFYRPVAYWIRQLHPGENRLAIGEQDRAERVPAEQIMHLRIVDRWPQVRGEPWLHAVMGKLADINGYTEAEIVAARAGAMYFATIETSDDTASLGEEQSDGTYQLPLEPGMVEKLASGEKLNFVSPNRPNSALEGFLRYMLREMAAGTGVSFESLSRDYSQSNYSSSRLALLEDRDNWRAIQQWFIRSFREPLHRLWLQRAAMANAIPGVSLPEYIAAPVKFEAVSFKPRGWSWVDPTKEVEAFKEAVKAGFTTVADVIAQTSGGLDIGEVMQQRRRELDEMEALDLSFDTSPENYAPPEPAPVAPPAPPPEPETDSTDLESRDVHVTVNMPEMSIQNHVPPSQLHVKAPIEIHAPINVERTVVNVPAANIENRFEIPATTVNVAAPQVHVASPEIHVPAARVTVENRVETPTVNVAAPQVTVEAPAVTVENRVESPVVNVTAPAVRVDNHVPEARTEVTVMNQLPAYEVVEQKVVRDNSGRIDGTITKRKRST